MHIRHGNYFLPVYLRQEIAMVVGVTCPKRDVGVIARQKIMRMQTISAEFTSEMRKCSNIRVAISLAVPEVFKTC